MRDLLLGLSLPARVLFLPIAAVIVAGAAVITAVGFWEGDGQVGLVPLFAGIYLAAAYLIVRGSDAAIRSVTRRLRRQWD